MVSVEELKTLIDSLKSEKLDDAYSIIHQWLDYGFMQTILALLEKYEITENENYLNQAKAIARSVYMKEKTLKEV